MPWSVAAAGESNPKLDRFNTTLEERGEMSVATAGLWNKKLDRFNTTMEERGEMR